MRAAEALVLVQDISGTASGLELALTQMFGLSPREAALAVELSEGYSLREICERRGVQDSTVQTQLKRAMEKTATRKQSALVRLVGRIPELWTGGK